MQDPAKHSKTDQQSNQAGSPEDLSALNYPPEEDMLNPANTMERVDLDVENITRSGFGAQAAGTPVSALPADNAMEKLTEDDEDDLGMVAGTEADVTAEDLLLLGPKDRDMDMGEDEALQQKGFPLGLTGEDLDVPGEELDDSDEAIGEEDEENNYYSLGGDNKDSLEEDQAGEDA